MNNKKVHCRKLEDGSGYGIFPGKKKLAPISIYQGGFDRWEEGLGVGETMSEAWKSYRNWEFNK